MHTSFVGGVMIQLIQIIQFEAMKLALELTAIRNKKERHKAFLQRRLIIDQLSQPLFAHDATFYLCSHRPILSLIVIRPSSKKIREVTFAVNNPTYSIVVAMPIGARTYDGEFARRESQRDVLCEERFGIRRGHEPIGRNGKATLVHRFPFFLFFLEK